MSKTRYVVPIMADLSDTPSTIPEMHRKIREGYDLVVGSRYCDGGKKIGGPVARIFDAQLLIANDEQFLNQVKTQIRSRRRNAGFIYNSLVQSTTAPLKSSPDA